MARGNSGRQETGAARGKVQKMGDDLTDDDLRRLDGETRAAREMPSEKKEGCEVVWEKIGPAPNETNRTV